MAKSKGRQVHPKGEKISVSPEERERFKKQRIAKKWDQYDLALHALGSRDKQPTVSNFESGRSKQVFKAVYAKLYRALFGPAKSELADSGTWLEIMEGSVNLDEQKQQAILEMVRQLARTR